MDLGCVGEGTSDFYLAFCALSRAGEGWWQKTDLGPALQGGVGGG